MKGIHCKGLIKSLQMQVGLAKNISAGVDWDWSRDSAESDGQRCWRVVGLMNGVCKTGVIKPVYRSKWG